MTARLAQLEKSVQNQILATIGALPDFLVMRNNVGRAKLTRDTGEFYFLQYGLGVGTPDLIGILSPSGRLVGLEIKAPGEDATPEQAVVHSAWRTFGAFVAVVRSPDEARDALTRARHGLFR